MDMTLVFYMEDYFQTIIEARKKKYRTGRDTDCKSIQLWSRNRWVLTYYYMWGQSTHMTCTRISATGWNTWKSCRVRIHFWVRRLGLWCYHCYSFVGAFFGLCEVLMGLRKRSTGIRRDMELIDIETSKGGWNCFVSSVCVTGVSYGEDIWFVHGKVIFWKKEFGGNYWIWKAHRKYRGRYSVIAPRKGGNGTVFW